MIIQEWRILCNVLKNTLDSFGISIVCDSFLKDLPQSKAGTFLQSNPSTTDTDIFIQGLGPDSSLFHITLNRIKRSEFALPSDPSRLIKARKLFKTLEDNQPNGITVKDQELLRRLSSAKDMQFKKAELLIWESWNNLPFVPKAKHIPKDQLPPPITAEEFLLRLSPAGDLLFIPSEQLMNKIIASVNNVSDNKILEGYSENFHLKLGYVKTIQSFENLVRTLKVYESTSWPIHMSIGYPRAVLYGHRSFSNIIESKYI